MTVQHHDSSAAEASAQPPDMRRHWRANLRVTGLLVGAWFFVTFVLGYFARSLDFTFFGWPFSFWVGAQGALIAYIAIIGFYAWYMNRLDRRYGEAEDD